MKKRLFQNAVGSLMLNLIGIGFVLGFIATLGVNMYGGMVAKSAYEDFKELIQVHTETAAYQAQGSDSQIVIYWNEPESLPYEKTITVRVKPDCEDCSTKFRNITFVRK